MSATGDSNQLARAEIDDLSELWLAAWTAAGGFQACCTGDVGYEDPLVRIPLAGVEAVEGHARSLRSAFPDVAVQPTAPPLHRGAHACVPWRLTGTHRGDIAILPATEQRLDIHGLHYLELTDGLVRRARGFVDLYDGATQLGLLPERGGLGESALMMLRGFGLRR
ncbi:MAG: ester cyclase [Thermoleophilaceae bacterium]